MSPQKNSESAHVCAVYRFLHYKAGHRQHRTSLLSCLMTAFAWPIHNESLNIWTCGFGCVLHLSIAAQAHRIILAASVSFGTLWLWRFVLLVQATCGIVGWSMVGCYHAVLCCNDAGIIDDWRRADAAGVILQGLGIGTMLLSAATTDWSLFWMISVHALGITSVLATLAFNRNIDTPLPLRICALAGSASIYFGVVMGRVWLLDVSGVFWDIACAVLSILIALAFFASHWPENRWPSSFWTNCVFQSHIIWHCGAIGYNHFLLNAAIRILEWRHVQH